MIKKYWIYILFLVSLVVFLISKCRNNKQYTKSNSGITARSFQTSYGWGYDILINDTIFIHQDIVPGISGKQGFKNEDQAAKVGTLVLDKMKRGTRLPSVTPRELDSLGIKN